VEAVLKRKKSNVGGIGMDVEAEAVKFLWKRKHFEKEAGSGRNSEEFDFLRIRKRKHFL